VPHWFYIVLVFVFGSCIGSFLNVVVWRLPRAKSLLWPPSACPKCGHQLGARDNIPVFGWIFLGGKCRYCRAPVSVRYPIIEAITGLLFVVYYVAFFVYGLGPSLTTYDSWGGPEHFVLRAIEQDWPVYVLSVVLVSMLLAASLIDAELYIIPIELPWTVAVVAFVGYALIASPRQPGALMAGPVAGAFAAGGAIGLLIANVLLWLKVLPRSFPQGEPILEWERKEMEKALAEEKKLKEQGKGAEVFDEPEKVSASPVLIGVVGVVGLVALGWLLWMLTQNLALAIAVASVVGLWFGAHVGIGAKISEELQEQEELPPVATKGEIRRQMLIEVGFALIPLVLAFGAAACALWVPSLRSWWGEMIGQNAWLSGLLGSVLGALVAGGAIWVTRALGTLILGRVAMGQGDTHLMMGIGAVLGAGPAVLVFFIAPFAGLAMGLYRWVSKGAREMPYGPYLSLAAAVVILLYRYVADYFTPSLAVIGDMLRQWMGG
jgi:leader peptidase (prepilin peptidase) / N-methyltransferase